jgi:HEAT repeat protein
MAEPLGGFDSDDWLDRFRAARLAGRRKDAAALPQLRRLLTDERSDVRAAAAKAIGELGDASNRAPLLRALEDPETNVRIRAAEALAALGDPSTVGAISLMLREKEFTTRVAVVAALSRFQSAALCPLVDTLRRDENGLVRSGAVEAIRSVCGTLPRDELPRFAHDALIESLSDRRPTVRLAAAIALKKVGNESALEPLRVARNREWRPLLRLHTSRALWGLRRRLRDELR